MELRSFNVERIWSSVVKCVIGDEIGVDKNKLDLHKTDIESMVDQIDMDDDGNCLFSSALVCTLSAIICTLSALVYTHLHLSAQVPSPIYFSTYLSA